MRQVQVDLEWPEQLDEELTGEIHAVVVDVVSSGGAVGWLTPPTQQAVQDWLTGLLHEDGRLVIARVDGRLAALGTWSRLPAEVLAHNGEIRRVMVHRSARGLGLGRRITSALIDSARSAGIEQLLCDVRGNNHAAIALYRSLGFLEYGRLPDFLAVGNHRFDRVRLYLPLQLPPDAVRHGSRAEGPGASFDRSSDVSSRDNDVPTSGNVNPEGPETAIAN